MGRMSRQAASFNIILSLLLDRVIAKSLCYDLLVKYTVSDYELNSYKQLYTKKYSLCHTECALMSFCPLLFSFDREDIF